MEDKIGGKSYQKYIKDINIEIEQSKYKLKRLKKRLSSYIVLEYEEDIKNLRVPKIFVPQKLKELNSIIYELKKINLYLENIFYCLQLPCGEDTRN